jgi:DJ-1 family protein
MKALVPIANGTEEMEAVIIIDMLRRAGIDVVVAGDGNVVTCSRGVRIVPDCILEDLSDDEPFDAIVLPGGSQGVENFIENAQLESMLQRHRERKGVIGAICAAPLVLHEFNMLSSASVITSHPSAAEPLSAYSYSLERVAKDGRLYTSRGAGTAFEFALALIRALTDDLMASRVASDIVLYE